MRKERALDINKPRQPQPRSLAISGVYFCFYLRLFIYLAIFNVRLSTLTATSPDNQCYTIPYYTILY